MRSKNWWILVPLVAVSGMAFINCSSDDDVTGSGGSGGSAGDSGVPDSGGGGIGTGGSDAGADVQQPDADAKADVTNDVISEDVVLDAGDTFGHLRIGHFAPDIAVNVDVCLRQHTGVEAPFTVGPVVNKILLSGAGLGYGKVSRYVSVTPGVWDLRIVAAGAADCSTALNNYGTIQNINVPQAAHVTLALEGLVTAVDGSALKPLGGMFFTDTATPVTGKALLRAVHLAPTTGAVDIGLASFTSSDAGDSGDASVEQYTPLLDNVSYGVVATSSNDAGAVTSGYLTVDPLTAATLAVRATGTSTDAITKAVASAKAGSIWSAFVIGSSTLSVVVCDDLDTSDAILSKCQ